MKRRKMLVLGAAAFAVTMLAAFAVPRDARAFCGFYVGKADASLINKASQVVIARHDNKTVISLMNDYEGEPAEFALVVPVPTVLKQGQVHIGDRELLRKLDSYSAPRLFVYFDPDPCAMPQPMTLMEKSADAVGGGASSDPDGNARSLGVSIEAQYTVGEYDIVILSAKDSNGLETWLIQSGYRIPRGAREALRPYIKQDMKFFVAKVNLGEQKRTGLSYLRPLQFAFESPKFMLPVRLGMINAQGPQDLVIYVLTRDGRVEATNYRTENLPTGADLPEYVRDEFGNFYKAMFGQLAARSSMSTMFTEYVWNMGWCDPCAGPPLSAQELKNLGVFWLDDDAGVRPMIYPPTPGPVPVMVTRLHVRYTRDSFPEDPVFQETRDLESYQARYVLRHAWKGSRDACPAAKPYFREVERRRVREAETLASLTGWNLNEVTRKAGANAAGGASQPWWESIWE
ncbi:MAG: DUF2330 domain-containing protein [Candidatus Binataceae bacterium]